MKILILLVQWGTLLVYSVKFVKFLGFDDNDVAWGQVNDGTALLPVKLMYPGGYFYIPEVDEQIIVSKLEDDNILYYHGQLSNKKQIFVDTDNKQINIDGLSEYDININNAVNVNVNAENVNINADNIKLGSGAANFVLTEGDTIEIPANSVLTAAQGGVFNAAPIACTITTQTTKTKAE